MPIATFECDGVELGRLWHCFGLGHHSTTLEEVSGLLSARVTNVLIAETHRLTKDSTECDLELGHSGIRLGDVERIIDTSQFHLAANVTGQSCAAAVLERCKIISDVCDPRFFKIEVLSRTTNTPMDQEVVDAVETLRLWNPSLKVLPLISAQLEAARRLVDLGCPLLRVVGSPIGSGRGIVCPESFGRICKLGIPVVLDGGVGSTADYRAARELGADGMLINSVLFSLQQKPSVVLREFAIEVELFESGRRNC